MTTVQTWQQHDFQRPNQQLYRKAGDFLSLSNFIPSPDGHYLSRAPGWSSHITYPTNFIEARGALYDQFYDNLVIVGAKDDSPDTVATFYIAQSDLSKSAVQTDSGAPTDLGGRHKQNVFYVFNDYWYIGTDRHVYKADHPYNGAAQSAVYSGGDARAIMPVRDTMYMITTSDEIYRWNEDDSQFESYFANWLEMGGHFITPFRDYFLFLGFHIDGSANLYRIDQVPPAELEQITRLDPHTAQEDPATAHGRWGTPWAIHDEDVYFCPGAYFSPDNTFEAVPIYRFTGSRVEHVETVDVPVIPYAWGLVKWQDRLLLYFLDDADQRIYVLHNDHFVQFMTQTGTLSDDAELYSIGGHLCLMTTENATQGLLLTRHKALTSTFTSSWLDMGHPASRKHLSRLAAIVSGQTTDLQVKIEYRTESGSWTEAVENDNDRYVTAGDLGVVFYLLQLRVTFTDETDPATYPDTRLESLAATYSYGVR